MKAWMYLSTIFQCNILNDFSRPKAVQFRCSVMSDSLHSMDGSPPGFPVHHQLPKLVHSHVHQVSDAIQPSHPL